MVFLDGLGGGKRKHQVAYSRVVFRWRHAFSNSPIFYVIYYIVSRVPHKLSPHKLGYPWVMTPLGNVLG